MCLPEPSQNIHKGNLVGIINDSNSLRMSRESRTCLLIGRIRRVACAVPDRRGVDPGRQTPNALLRSPEAAIGKDGDLIPWGNVGDGIAGDVVLIAVDVGHLIGSTGKRLGGVNETGFATAQHVEESHVKRSAANVTSSRGDELSS